MGGNGGITPSPPPPIVLPGTITALHVVSPLKNGMGIEKYPISMPPPLYYFLLIRTLAAAGIST